MNAVIQAMTFAARHLLIVPVAMIAGCVLWTVVYVLLLLVAVIGNQGVGGPLAYPAGIVAIIAASVLIGWGIFAPASAMGAVFCKLFGWPRIAAVPVVFGAALILSYWFYWLLIHALTTHSMPSMWVVLKYFTIYLSVPLGAYWWVTEGPGTLLDAFRRRVAKRRHGATNRETPGL